MGGSVDLKISAGNGDRRPFASHQTNNNDHHRHLSTTTMEGVSTIPVPVEDDMSFQPPTDEQNDGAPVPSPPNPQPELLDPLDAQNVDLEASPDGSKTSTRLVKFQLFETKAVSFPLIPCPDHSVSTSSAPTRMKHTTES
jgi:hypothetical protein